MVANAVMHQDVGEKGASEEFEQDTVGPKDCQKAAQMLCMLRFNAGVLGHWVSKRISNNSSQNSVDWLRKRRGGRIRGYLGI